MPTIINLGTIQGLMDALAALPGSTPIAFHTHGKGPFLSATWTKIDGAIRIDINTEPHVTPAGVVAELNKELVESAQQFGMRAIRAAQNAKIEGDDA